MQDRWGLRSIDFKTEIHPTAIVHPWARLGVGVKVGPYSIIGEHVELGDGCVVGPRVLIEGRTVVGRNNTFFHGATIGSDPQDLKYGDQVSYLHIGDDNTFREFVTVHRATGEGETTLVGSGSLLMAYAHVAHNCVIGDGVVLANTVNLAGHVLVDDFAAVGGVTCVHQFVRIGKYSFIGGGSRIERDVPPFVRVAGSPARVYGVNAVGLERRGFSVERRTMVGAMFKVLYRRGLNVSQALEQLRNGDFQDPERGILVDFLESTERGITK